MDDVQKHNSYLNGLETICHYLILGTFSFLRFPKSVLTVLQTHAHTYKRRAIRKENEIINKNFEPVQTMKRTTL
jgi:hypothetical protein